MIDQDKMRALAAKLRKDYADSVLLTAAVLSRSDVSRAPLEAADAIDLLLAEVEAANAQIDALLSTVAECRDKAFVEGYADSLLGAAVGSPDDVPGFVGQTVAELRAELEAVAADKRELFSLLPGPYYMDLPDGGDVSLIEQLRRMAKDAERYRWLRDEDAGVPNGERELCVVQFRLPFTGAPDRDLFDVALDAAIDAALAQRQGEGS